MAVKPVHPRPRGEHLRSPITRVTSFGSSPPARGTLGDSLVILVSLRFIPARAGNTAVPAR